MKAHTISLAVFVLGSLVFTTLALSQQEILALQDLAQAIPALQKMYPPWNANDASRACGPAWTGLKCNTDRSVVQLSLASNDGTFPTLYGKLPDSIGSLTNLELFSLQNTNLNGTIPTTAGNWKQLKFLKVLGNRELGPFPDVFSEMPLLETVEIETRFSNASFPSSLSECANLKIVSLAGDYEIDRLPQSLSKWTQLTHLQINAAFFRGSSLDVLTQIPLLTRFDLHSMQPFTAELPRQLPNLKYLSLGGYTGPFPTRLFDDYPQLKSLELENSNFLGSQLLGPNTENHHLKELRVISTVASDLYKYTFPTSFNNLKALKLLEISRTVNGPLPATLGPWVNMTQLKLGFNALNGSIPDTSGMPKLEELLLSSGNSFSGPLPSSLSSLSRLRTLGIDGNVSGCFHETPDMRSCDISGQVCVCGAKKCKNSCSASEVAPCCVSQAPTAAAAGQTSSGGLIAGIIIGLVVVIALPVAIILYNRSKRDAAAAAGYQSVPMEERQLE